MWTLGYKGVLYRPVSLQKELRGLFILVPIEIEVSADFVYQTEEGFFASKAMRTVLFARDTYIVHRSACAMDMQCIMQR